MTYYKRCKICGATLDPGERCDCLDKKATPGTANTESCKVDMVQRPKSTSIITKQKENVKYE